MADPDPSEMSEGEKIARVVASQLSGALSQTFSYDVMPDIDLKDLAGSTLGTVRDINEEMTFAGGSRSLSRHEYHIEVCLRRQVSHSGDVHVSQLKKFLQQVAEYFRFRELTDRPERLIRADSRRIMEDEAFKDRGVIKASIVLVFQGWRN